MKEESNNHFLKKMNSWSRFSGIVLCIYILSIVGLYDYYQTKTFKLRADILEEKAQEIISLTVNKLEDLTISSDKEFSVQSTPSPETTSISIHNHKLEVCANHNCVNYNLLRLCSLIDSSVPKFTHYRLLLNNTLIHSNNKDEVYIHDKTYKKDNLLFQVQLNLAKEYWRNKQSEVMRPFWLTFLITSLTLVVSYFFHRKLLYEFGNESWFSYLKEKSKIIQTLSEEQTISIKKFEDQLQRRIWDLEMLKKRDIEFNYLFTLSLSQIALEDRMRQQGGYLSLINIVDFEKKVDLEKSAENLPSYIILQKNRSGPYGSDQLEKINIRQIKEDFEKRFFTLKERVLIENTPHLDRVYFSSRSWLYQVMYSLVSYLFFLLKENDPSQNHEITIMIDEIDGKAVLRFKLSKKLYLKQKVSMQSSRAFFQHHANLFILDIQQIVDRLKGDGYHLNLNTSNEDYFALDITPSINEAILSEVPKGGSERLQDKIITIPFRKAATSAIKTKAKIARTSRGKATKKDKK